MEGRGIPLDELQSPSLKPFIASGAGLMGAYEIKHAGCTFEVVWRYAAGDFLICRVDCSKVVHIFAQNPQAAFKEYLNRYG